MQLSVSLVQMRSVNGKLASTFSRTERLVEAAARRGSQLVCLPEMWTTGFDWKAIRREAPNADDVVARMGRWAVRFGVWINGTIPALNEAGKPTNTSVLVDNQGRVAGVYRKMHLFSLMHEDHHLAAGDQLVTVATPWGVVGLAVCYDVRFPELFRSYAMRGTDMVLLPAAFPHPRLDHWKILVRARAIENQLFMVAANQVGEECLAEGGRVNYFGHSSVIDPWGRTVVEANESESLVSVAIDLDEAAHVRSHMGVLQDRRPELYELGGNI